MGSLLGLGGLLFGRGSFVCELMNLLVWIWISSQFSLLFFGK